MTAHAGGLAPGPITSRSAAWGSLVKVRASGRASRRGCLRGLRTIRPRYLRWRGRICRVIAKPAWGPAEARWALSWPAGCRYRAVSQTGGGQPGRLVQRREPVRTLAPLRVACRRRARHPASITHPDAGVETAPMPPRPNQQPDSATGRPQRGVVGQHPAEEEVVPAALQVDHRRHPGGVGAMISGLPIRVVRGVADPLLKPSHPPPGQRDVGVCDGSVATARRIDFGPVNTPKNWGSVPR
jgi:hypothetical protein